MVLILLTPCFFPSHQPFLSHLNAHQPVVQRHKSSTGRQATEICMPVPCVRAFRVSGSDGV